MNEFYSDFAPVIDNEIVVDPDCIFGEHGTQLLEFWHGARGDAPRPRWPDLDLMEIYKIAPYLTVKDVVNDGEEFRTRYYGTELTNILGYDGTGKLLADYYIGDNLTYVSKICRAAVESLSPVQSSGRVFWARHREHWNYLSLYLPLDDAAGNPTHLIGVFDFHKA